MPEITFSNSNLEGVILGHDDPMIISAVMVNTEVKKAFVNQGSSADIIFRDTFDKFGLNNSDLQAYKEELIGFFKEKVHPDEFVTLHLTLGSQPHTRTIKINFLVVDCPSANNVILGRLTLNKIGSLYPWHV